MIGQEMAVDHGGIAALPFERIGEARSQRRERLRAGKAGHRRAARWKRLPQIVDAVAMIGMVVGPDHRVDVADAGIEQLLAQVGAGVDQDPRPVMLDQDRDPAAAVARLVRDRSRPSHCRPAARRTTCRSRECAASRRRLGEQPMEIGAGGLGQALDRLAAQLGEEARRVGDEGRLAGLAAMRHRREEGRIGFDQQPVERDRPAPSPADRARS